MYIFNKIQEKDHEKFDRDPSLENYAEVKDKMAFVRREQKTIRKEAVHHWSQ